MCCDDGVFLFFVCGYEFVEESEELVDLLFGEVCVVGGVFDFEGEGVLVFSCHDVGERVEAGVADWDADGVVPVFLEEFDEYVFAVEASFAPSAKRDLVNFFHGSFFLCRCGSVWIASAIKDYCTLLKLEVG